MFLELLSEYPALFLEDFLIPIFIGWSIHFVISFYLQLYLSRYDSTRNELISDEIGVAYLIQNGIPNLIPHDGKLLKKNGTTSTTSDSNQDL